MKAGSGPCDGAETAAPGVVAGTSSTLLISSGCEKIQSAARSTLLSVFCRALMHCARVKPIDWSILIPSSFGVNDPVWQRIQLERRIRLDKITQFIPDAGAAAGARKSGSSICSMIHWVAASNPRPCVKVAARLQAGAGKPISTREATISMSTGGSAGASEFATIFQNQFQCFPGGTNDKSLPEDWSVMITSSGCGPCPFIHDRSSVWGTSTATSSLIGLQSSARVNFRSCIHK